MDTGIDVGTPMDIDVAVRIDKQIEVEIHRSVDRWTDGCMDR